MNNQQQELLTKLLEKEEKRKEAMRKYQRSEKGKLAQKRANAKRYIPTGRPRGRPKKKVESK